MSFRTLVVVVSSDERDAQWQDGISRKKLGQRLDERLEPLGSSSVIDEEQIPDLHLLFVQKFGSRTNVPEP